MKTQERRLYYSNCQSKKVKKKKNKYQAYPWNTHKPWVRVCGPSRCSRVQHRTRTHHTRDPNTAGIPVPMNNPNHQCTAPYTLAHNSWAECLHRTILGRAWLMRLACNVPASLWDEFWQLQRTL